MSPLWIVVWLFGGVSAAFNLATAIFPVRLSVRLRGAIQETGWVAIAATVRYPGIRLGLCGSARPPVADSRRPGETGPYRITLAGRLLFGRREIRRFRLRASRGDEAAGGPAPGRTHRLWRALGRIGVRRAALKAVIRRFRGRVTAERLVLRLRLGSQDAMVGALAAAGLQAALAAGAAAATRLVRTRRRPIVMVSPAFGDSGVHLTAEAVLSVRAGWLLLTLAEAAFSCARDAFRLRRRDGIGDPGAVTVRGSR